MRKMRKTKIILTGAQGTGKSTLNEALQNRLAIEFPGIKFIDSMSKKFFKKKDFKDLFSDDYLKAQQKIYEYASSEYLADNEFLSSRGFADSYAYLIHSYEITHKQEFKDLIKRNFRNNKDLINSREFNVYTFYVPIEFEIEGKNLRSTDKKFQKEIDRNIKEFLDRSQTLYTTVHGSVKERVNQILKTLHLEISDESKGII